MMRIRETETRNGKQRGQFSAGMGSQEVAWGGKGTWERLLGFARISGAVSSAVVTQLSSVGERLLVKKIEDLNSHLFSVCCITNACQHRADSSMGMGRKAQLGRSEVWGEGGNRHGCFSWQLCLAYTSSLETWNGEAAKHSNCLLCNLK